MKKFFKTIGYAFIKSLRFIKKSLRSAARHTGRFFRLIVSEYRKICAVICGVFAVFCALYWLICGFFAGFGISVLWIWPLFSVLSVFLALWFAGLPPFVKLSKHKLLRITVLSLVALMLVCFCTAEGLIISSMTADCPEKLDYIIVLGARVNGSTPSLALRHRIEKAYDYLSENPDTYVIASGGRGKDEEISEAEAIRRELMAKGIGEERIITETRSTSTEENLVFSYELIPDDRTSVGLVTNNFHVFRAMRLAKSIGKDPCGIAAPYPNALILHYMVREFFALALNIFS